MLNKKLEICCYSVEAAIIAEKNGADRIELCDNYLEGGTTPSIGTIQHCVDHLNIPLNIIIRPRGGDFLYTKLEYETILNEIEKLKGLNINGIVIGFLQQNGEIDIERTKEVVDLVSPLEVTFHRAFDMCKDPIKALEQLIDIGVKRILTSGAQKTAIEGIILLKTLVHQANERISIMPGCGVNESNLNELMTKTRAFEFHSSAKTFQASEMAYFNPNISMGGNNSFNEYQKITVDSMKIITMVNILKGQQHIN